MLHWFILLCPKLFSVSHSLYISGFQTGYSDSISHQTRNRKHLKSCEKKALVPHQRPIFLRIQKFETSGQVPAHLEDSFIKPALLQFCREHCLPPQGPPKATVIELCVVFRVVFLSTSARVSSGSIPPNNPETYRVGQKARLVFFHTMALVALSCL